MKKQEQCEKLFAAIGEVGEDLVVNAEVKIIRNPWRHWSAIAATLALVICLGAVALPYFPSGCGAQNQQTADMAAPPEAMEESAPEESKEWPEEEPGVEEEQEVTEDKAESQYGGLWVRPRIVFEEFYYHQVWENEVFTEAPRSLGKLLGQAKAVNDSSLDGCNVYEHEADSGSEYVWVETPAGYVLFESFWEPAYNSTSVGDLADVEGNIAVEDTILRSYVEPIEAVGGIEFRDAWEVTGDMARRMFLATVAFPGRNPDYGDLWLSDDGKTHIVPLADVAWHLKQYLPSNQYESSFDPAVLVPDDPELNALVFSEEEWNSLSHVPLSLESIKEVEADNTAYLTVSNGENDRIYVIRFDGDHWRYIRIYTQDTLKNDQPVKTQEDFYQLFPELEKGILEQFGEQIGKSSLADFRTDVESLGTEIGKTTAGDRILAIDVPNRILLVETEDEAYRAVLAIAKDPSRLSIRAGDSYGVDGNYIGDIAEDHNGVLAMNASGFLPTDSIGESGQGIPEGYFMSDNQVLNGLSNPNFQRLEIGSDNRFYIADGGMPVDPMTTDAMEHGPALIREGQVQTESIKGYNGVHPRACIGQNGKGEILMLVVEGRLPGYSLGADLATCAEILQRYGAENAIQAGSGTSAMLWYNGQYVTQCPNRETPQGRLLPNAFVYSAGTEQ